MSLYHFCDYGHNISAVTAASFLWMGVLYFETFCEFQDKHCSIYRIRLSSFCFLWSVISHIKFFWLDSHLLFQLDQDYMNFTCLRKRFVSQPLDNYIHSAFVNEWRGLKHNFNNEENIEEENIACFKVCMAAIYTMPID